MPAVITGQEYPPRLNCGEQLITVCPVCQQRPFTYIGNNVNLANVRYYDVIALEGLRRGLRGDTLRIVVKAANK